MHGEINIYIYIYEEYYYDKFVQYFLSEWISLILNSLFFMFDDYMRNFYGKFLIRNFVWKFLE